MLFLHFRIGQDNVALAAHSIVEIVPLAEVRSTRQAAAGHMSFDYRGRFIPAVDLCQRELGRPARRRLSTRIVVVRGHDDDLVGLIAEHATTMLRIDPAEFAPFARGPDGLIQRVWLQDLLPAAQAGWA